MGESEEQKRIKSFPYEGQEWYQLGSSGFELQAEEDEFGNFAVFTNPTQNNVQSPQVEKSNVDDTVSSSNDKRQRIPQRKCLCSRRI